MDKLELEVIPIHFGQLEDDVSHKQPNVALWLKQKDLFPLWDRASSFGGLISVKHGQLSAVFF